MYLQKPSAGDFTPPPAGTHLGICYRVIDLGTQLAEWQGEKKKQHKVMLSWELPQELMEDGQPFSIHQRYTFSTHEKAKFRQDLESWRGKPFEEKDFNGPPDGFNVKKLIGVPCLIGVIHKTKDGKTYANISSISKIMKGTQIPALHNEAMFFDLATFDPVVFERLSQGLQEVIKKSPEYAEIMHKRSVPDEEPPPPNSAGDYGDMDQEIPF